MDILYELVVTGAMSPGHVDTRDHSPGRGVDMHVFFLRGRSKDMSKALHCKC